MFRLTERAFSDVLKIDFTTLRRLISGNKPYNIFDRPDTKGKIRHYEEPIGHLKQVQKRIHNLLLRITPPEYLSSPAKGRSSITNAAIHRHGRVLKTLDIRNFFPSTRREMVFRFFRKGLQCSVRISELLTEICIRGDALPTGGPTSPIMAFYAYKPMWEKVKKLVESEGCIFSIYVDDLTVSGDRVSGLLMWNIEKILFQNGLRCHPKKKMHFKAHQTREITGVIVKNGELRMPT